MVALKFLECEFKGLLNFVQERIKHVYGINSKAYVRCG